MLSVLAHAAAIAVLAAQESVKQRPPARPIELTWLESTALEPLLQQPKVETAPDPLPEPLPDPLPEALPDPLPELLPDLPELEPRKPPADQRVQPAPMASVPHNSPEQPDRAAPLPEPTARADQSAASPAAALDPTVLPADRAPGTGSLTMRGSASAGAGSRAEAPAAGQPGGRMPMLSPAQAARLIEPDQGPMQRSPLELPGTGVPRRPRSEIVPDGKGAYRAEDLTFRAAIGRDGRVQLEDKPDIAAQLGAPSKNESLESGSADSLQGANGVTHRFPANLPTVLSGNLDATAWLMRRVGQDPYLRRKLAFMERTRDQRAEMAARDHAEVTREALSRLSSHLTAIWAHETWPVAERRRALFELWDECAESGPEAEAGRAARATIVAFIRQRLPRGSAHAFSAAELHELNRTRSSTEEFAPYR